MSSYDNENNNKTALAVTGTASAVSLILSIAAISVAASKSSVDVTSIENRLDALEDKVPVLFDDGAGVAGSVSLLGAVPVTSDNALHFKSLNSGAGIDISETKTTLTISSITDVTLTTATATGPNPVSIVSTASSSNFPQVRNLIAGAGISLTLSGNDIIIALI